MNPNWWQAIVFDIAYWAWQGREYAKMRDEDARQNWRIKP